MKRPEHGAFSGSIGPHQYVDTGREHEFRRPLYFHGVVKAQVDAFDHLARTASARRSVFVRESAWVTLRRQLLPFHPNTRNRRAAIGAASVADLIEAHAQARTLDQDPTALRTERVSAAALQHITQLDDPQGRGEALTGEGAGWVWSRERPLRGADAVRRSGRPHPTRRLRQTCRNPARSETPSMHGSNLHGTREILDLAVSQQRDGPRREV